MRVSLRLGSACCGLSRSAGRRVGSITPLGGGGLDGRMRGKRGGFGDAGLAWIVFLSQPLRIGFYFCGQPLQCFCERENLALFEDQLVTVAVGVLGSGHR